MLRYAGPHVRACPPRVALLLCTAALCSLATEIQPVVVVNHAGVEPRMLAAAQKVAGQIYRRAGIDLTWHGYDEKSLAQRPLILLLVRTEGPASSKGALGYALVTKDGGERMVLYCGRLWNLVRSCHPPASPEQILGHTMAHEIGHLLSIVKHSPTGIMRSWWDAQSFWRMAQGELFFTGDEAARMRAAVRRRAEQ